MHHLPPPLRGGQGCSSGTTLLDHTEDMGCLQMAEVHEARGCSGESLLLMTESPAPVYHLVSPPCAEGHLLEELTHKTKHWCLVLEGVTFPLHMLLSPRS